MESLKLYMVEDSAVIRENMAATLNELAQTEMLGYAEAEDEAKRWLTAHRDEWDLAIVDLFLREGNGLGVLEALAQRRAEQQVVVLTNYASPGIRAQCLRLGADAVFDKSNEIDALVDFCLSTPPRRSGNGGTSS